MGRAEASPKRSRLRRVLRVLAILLATPFLLVALVLGYLHTGSGRELLRQKIETRVGERLDGTFELGAVELALFGDIAVRNVRVLDAAGAEVATLGAVEITPAWRRLLRGEIVLARVVLDGLSLDVVQRADGGSNLRDLLKPQPETPKEPAKERRIQVESLIIGRVGVTIHKPDGTRMQLQDFELAAAIDATPVRKTAHVTVPRIGARFTLEKPGLTVELSDVATGLTVDLVDGAGSIALAPTKAHARLVQPGTKDRGIDLDLDGITLAVEPGKLGATLEKLLVGPLLLQSLEIRGGVEDGGLRGEQLAQVVGLEVDRTRVNALLGRELLASNVDVAFRLSGPPEKLVLGTKLAASGATLSVDGVVDASKPDTPVYDATLLASDVDVSRIVHSDKIPPVTVRELRLAAKGRGKTRDAAVVDLGLHIADAVVDKHAIDRLDLDAHYDRGTLTIESLVLEAYGNELSASGSVDLATKKVALHLTVAGDVGRTLERLQRAGLQLKTSLPAGALALRKDVLTVDVSGDLEGLLRADVRIDGLALAGGTVFAAIHAELWRNATPAPDQKKVELRALDGTVDLRSLSLNRLLALRGRKLDTFDATVSGRLAVANAPEDPNGAGLRGPAPELQLDYDLTVRATPREVPDPGTLVARAHGKATKQVLGLEIGVTGQHTTKRTDLLTVNAHVPLLITPEKKGFDPTRALALSIDLPKRTFAELVPYLPKKAREKKLPEEGHVEAHVRIEGTAPAPAGTLAVAIDAAALGGRRQRLVLDGTLRTDRPRVILTTGLGAWLDTDRERAANGQIRVELGRSPLVGPGSVDWALDLDVAPQVLAQLPLPADRVAGLAGTAGAGIHLRGDLADLGGTLELALAGVGQNGKGPLDGKVAIAIQPDDTTLAIDLDLAATRVVHASGTIGRPGRGLVRALRRPVPDGTSIVDKLGVPTLALALELPEHPIATHAALAPKLEALPGTLGGRIEIGGDLRTPIARGGIAYEGFQTRSGKPERASLAIDAGARNVHAAIAVGAVQDGDPPIGITVGLPRDAIAPYRAAKDCLAAPPGAQPCPEATLPIQVHVAADAPIADVLPDFAVANRDLTIDGTLHWALDGTVVLDPRHPPLSRKTTLAGELSIAQGVFPLPGTGRSFHDVAFTLRHDMKQVRIEKLSLRERDLEKPERKLDLTGTVDLTDLKAPELDARLTARDWLVFGHEKVGPADAPRGVLTADLGVTGNLGGPVRRIDIEVDALELLIPDRFLRAHQPEETSLGDVVYLDPAHPTPGRLPYTPVLAPPAPPPPGAPEEGLDLHVRIPKPIHVLQAPIDLIVSGSIDVKRRGDARSVTGELQASGGGLDLGGHRHDLEKGTIRFDAENPGGYMDLFFARREPDPALRDLSKASAGEHVRIRMTGPLDNRKTRLSGAGSPGTLFDLLAIHNTGRPRYLSEPDVPASTSTQYPQHDNLLLVSYLAVNAPHLLFLDKFGAWADPYDGRGTSSYGRIQHYEAEGSSDDGSVRVRAQTQPRGAGQSSAELAIDWLFVSTPRTAFGVGVTAGDRLGGGPGLVFDWSSED